MLSERQKEVMSLSRGAWLTRKFHTGKPSNIVIKLTRDCNLRCVYCYTKGGENRECISLEIIESFFDQLAEDNPCRIYCTIHGGEPLMAPELLKSMVRMLKSKYYGPRLNFTIQTNATLINNQWIDFLKENFHSIGISIDGPADIHNRTRVYPNGRGSFEQVEKNLKLINEAGLRKGVICVITKQNVDHMVDILEWCDQVEIRSICFNPFFTLGYGEENADLSADMEVYWNNTEKAIQWLVKHNSSVPEEKMIFERDIASIARNIIAPGNKAFMCASIPCGAGTRHLGLDVNGNVEVCDTLYGYDNYILGNIKTTSLNQILQNPLIDKFSKRSHERTQECAGCDLKKWCYGGCPAGNIIYYGEKGFELPSFRCAWYKKIIPYLKERFETGEIAPFLLFQKTSIQNTNCGGL